MTLRVRGNSPALLRHLPLALAAILGCVAARQRPAPGIADQLRCVRSTPPTSVAETAGDGFVIPHDRLPPVDVTPARHTQRGLAALHALIARFRADHSRLPDSLAQLWPLGLPPAAQLDGWGHAFLYQRRGGDYTVGSAGADGEAGTADDVRSVGPCRGSGPVIEVPAVGVPNL